MRGIPFTATAILCFSFASISAGQNVSVATPPTASAQQAQARTAAGEPHTGDRRGATRGPGASPWVQRGFASAAISESRGSTAPPIAGAAPVRASRRFRTRTGPRQCERNTAQCAVVTHIPSCGRRFPEPETRFRRLSGYFEMDFAGTTPGTVAVTSTSVGLRLRQAFAEVQYGERSSWPLVRPSP